MEDVGTARIPLVRTGGNYGDQMVTFTTQNFTAYEGVDYSVPSNTVKFKDGQTSATINITIHDDTEMESAEFFTITLSDITGM